MTTERILQFKGLDRAVSLTVGEQFLTALSSIIPNWPYSLQDRPKNPVFATVRMIGTGYELSSPFMNDAVRYKDCVNTICALIVELAWAHLRARPELLCLHGAAVNIGGRLVVFPSSRRTGKSTFSVALMTAGHQIFTDDFLPLEIGGDHEILGLAQGIAPRLRLPLPTQFSGRSQAYLDEFGNTGNKQYLYAHPKPDDLANFGDALPLGSVVLLEQKPGANATFRPCDATQVLKTLITQNFSRAMNAAGILETLAAIAANAPAFILEYDEIDPAIQLLEQKFEHWDHKPPTVTRTDPGSFSQAPEYVPTATDTVDWQIAPVTQAENISEIALGNERFLAAPCGRAIVHLNSTAAIVWQLLTDGATLRDLQEMLAALFPEQTRDDLWRDVSKTLEYFAESGLLVRATADGMDRLQTDELSGVM